MGDVEIVESVPGALLILRVGSRSGLFKEHFVNIAFGDDGRIAEVTCSCKGFEYHGYCHHVTSVRDLIGRVEHDNNNGEPETRTDSGGPEAERPPLE
jgi:hypothetical protein